jgi:hypothetical protein
MHEPDFPPAAIRIDEISELHSLTQLRQSTVIRNFQGKIFAHFGESAEVILREMRCAELRVRYASLIAAEKHLPLSFSEDSRS